MAAEGLRFAGFVPGTRRRIFVEAADSEDAVPQALALDDMHPPSASKVMEEARELQSPKIAEWPNWTVARQRITSKINSLQRKYHPPPYGKTGVWNNEAAEELTEWLQRLPPAGPPLALPAPPPAVPLAAPAPLLALPAPPVEEEADSGSSDDSPSDSDKSSSGNGAKSDSNEEGDGKEGSGDANNDSNVEVGSDGEKGDDDEDLSERVVQHELFLEIECERNELAGRMANLTSELKDKDQRIVDLEKDCMGLQDDLDTMRYELMMYKKQRRDP